MKLLVFNLAVDEVDTALGFAVSWINQLAQRWDQVDVLTMRTGTYRVAENVNVFSVGKERGWSEARRAVEFYKLLFRLLHHNHYAACFAHMMPLFAVMGWPLLRQKHIPITLWYTHKSVPPMLRLAEKCVHTIVSASAETFRLPSNKLLVTGHGIDTQIFCPAPPASAKTRPFTILSVSRIAPVKQIEALIEGIHYWRTHDTPPPFEVHLVGGTYPQDQAYQHRLEQQIRDYQLEPFIHFRGLVTFRDLPPLYQSADLLMNTSLKGGLDKSVLEAMSCGCLVLTSNPVFMDLLQPWKSALFLDHNEPQLIASHLQVLVQHSPEQREQMGLALRGVVETQHSLNRLMDRLSEDILLNN